MAEKELQIKLRVDRAEAKRAADEELQSLTKVRDAHRRASTEQERDDRRTAENARRQSGRSAEAQIQAINKTRDAHGRSVGQAIRDQKRLADEGTRGWGRMGGAIGSAAGVLKSYTGQMLGVTSAQAGMAAIAREFERIRDAAKDAAKETTKLLDDLRGVAFAKGTPGEMIGAEMGQLALRQQTLQSRAEARAFEVGFIGSGEPFVSTADEQKRISQSEFAKLQVIAGRRQAATGFDPEAAARFHAMMPMIMNQPGEVTAAETATSAGAALEMFRMSSADPSVLMDKYREQAGMMTRGTFKDELEMAAMLSAAGSVEGAGAGQWMDQIFRVTIGSMGRLRGAKVMEGLAGKDVELEKRGEYLAGIGAKPKMTVLEIADLMLADIEAQKANDANFDINTYLQAKGYGSSVQDLSAFSTYSAVRRELETTYLPIAANPEAAAGKLDASFDVLQAGRVGQARRVEIAADANQFQTGLELGEVENARQAMYEKMRAEHKTRTGTDLGEYESYLKGGLSGVGRLETVDAALGDFYNAQLPAEQRLNVDSLFPQTRTSRLQQLSGQVAQAGGETMPDLGGLLAATQRTAEAVEEGNRLAKEARDRRNQPPLPAALPPPKPAAGAIRP